MTCQEIHELRDSTLDNLIGFNRELKISYSSIQQKHTQVTDEMPQKMKDFSKDIRNIKFNPDNLDTKMEMHAQDCITQIRQLQNPMPDFSSMLHAPLLQMPNFKEKDEAIFPKREPFKVRPDKKLQEIIQSEKEAPSASQILSKLQASKVKSIIGAFRRYKLRKELGRRAAVRRI